MNVSKSMVNVVFLKIVQLHIWFYWVKKGKTLYFSEIYLKGINRKTDLMGMDQN